MVRRRYAAFAILLPVFTWACSGESVTQPTTSTQTFAFAASLSAPQVQSAGPALASTPSGAVTMTLVVATDSANDIIGARATFAGNFVGFTESRLTSAHVNSGAAGTIGPIVIDLGGLGAFPNDSGSMNVSISVPTAVAAQIIANPSGFYFEAGTAQNPVGAVRGQFVNATP